MKRRVSSRIASRKPSLQSGNASASFTAESSSGSPNHCS
jgi:hypothetical protein